MPKNIGTIDKILRISVAIIIAILYFLNIITGTLSTILLIVAFALIITSIFGLCPLYLLLNISTRKNKG